MTSGIEILLHSLLAMITAFIAHEATHYAVARAFGAPATVNWWQMETTIYVEDTERGDRVLWAVSVAPIVAGVVVGISWLVFVGRPALRPVPVIWAIGWLVYTVSVDDVAELLRDGEPDLSDVERRQREVLTKGAKRTSSAVIIVGVGIAGTGPIALLLQSLGVALAIGVVIRVIIEIEKTAPENDRPPPNETATDSNSSVTND
jgi:hypothetical protein